MIERNVRNVPNVSVGGASANPGIVGGLLGPMLRNQANGTEGSIIESGSAGCAATGFYNSQAGGTSTPGNRRALFFALDIVGDDVTRLQSTESLMGFERRGTLDFARLDKS